MVGNAEFGNRRQRVAAARNGEARAFGNRPCHRFRTARKLGKFKHAHRAVPHNRARVFQNIGKLGGRLFADVQNHIVCCHIVHRFMLRRRAFGKFFGCNHVHRQGHNAAFGLHFGDDFFRFVHQIRLGKRFANGFALRQQEGVGDAAAHNQMLHFICQAVQNGELGGHFAARHNRHQRAGGGFQGFAQRVQFRRHQNARTRQRRSGGNGFGRCLGAVRGAKGIVHKNIAQSGVGFAQLGVVFLFAFIHAHVLQQRHFARFQAGFALAPIIEHGDVAV